MEDLERFAGSFQNYKSKPGYGIQKDWWNKKWIPLAWDGSGNNICLDLTPALDGGIYGLIMLSHDISEIGIEADSFREWLEVFVNNLELGKYVYSEDFDGFVSVDDI